jgi:hypothetical protein
MWSSLWRARASAAFIIPQQHVTYTLTARGRALLEALRVAERQEVEI